MTLLEHTLLVRAEAPMGGHLDAGESPAAAALREPAARGEPEHLHFDVRYIELMNEEASTRAIAKIRALLGP